MFQAIFGEGSAPSSRAPTRPLGAGLGARGERPGGPVYYWDSTIISRVISSTETQ